MFSFVYGYSNPVFLLISIIRCKFNISLENLLHIDDNEIKNLVLAFKSRFQLAGYLLTASLSSSFFLWLTFLIHTAIPRPSSC